jgi:hypothetical protein
MALLLIAKIGRWGYHLYQVSWRLPMTTTARNLLAAFDALPPAEQQQVAAEILRRTAVGGEVSGETLDELAGELFRSYDAEEAARGNP